MKRQGSQGDMSHGNGYGPVGDFHLSGSRKVSAASLLSVTPASARLEVFENPSALPKSPGGLFDNQPHDNQMSN